MIDIERSLYNDLATHIYEEFPEAYVANIHQLKPPSFPAVFIEQSFSSELDLTRDSSHEEVANAIIWTINVYSNSQTNADGECRQLLDIVDRRLRLYNMKRLTSRPIDNAADPSITRRVGRYTGIVEYDGTMYWR